MDQPVTRKQAYIAAIVLGLVSICLGVAVIASGHFSEEAHHDKPAQRCAIEKKDHHK